MKKLLHIALLLPLLGQAQTAQVHIAGSDYPAIFAETNLSFKVRQRIANDLKIVFSPSSSFEEAQDQGTYGEVDATVSLPGGGTAVTKDINGLKLWAGVFKPNREKTVFTTEKESEGIFLVDYNNVKSVRLNEVASSNYVHAFKLVDAHSNAVQKAHEFMAAMKNTDWSTQPLQALKNLHHLTPEDEADFRDIEDYRAFAELAQQHLILKITALGFSLETRPEVGDKKVLVYGNVLIFYDGRWGFGRFPGM